MSVADISRPTPGFPAPGHRMNGYTLLATSILTWAADRREAVVLGKCDTDGGSPPMFVTALVHARQGSEPSFWHHGYYCETLVEAMRSFADRGFLLGDQAERLHRNLERHLRAERERAAAADLARLS